MSIESPSTLYPPPSTSFAPALLVFEKRTRWGTELKRHLAGYRLFIRSHTTATEIPAALVRFPSSLVVLDLDSDPAACLGVLRTVHERHLAARFIAIASASLTDLEWPLREAGVVNFVADTIRGEELAGICLRNLKVAATPPAA